MFWPLGVIGAYATGLFVYVLLILTTTAALLHSIFREYPFSLQ